MARSSLAFLLAAELVPNRCSWPPDLNGSPTETAADLVARPCYLVTMNEQLRPPPFALRPRPATTRAADGLPRRKWTAAEVRKMLEAGLIHEDDRLELLGGELVAMAARGNRHERLKIELNAFWMKIRPPEIMAGQETPLRLDEHYEPEPDFIVYPKSILPHDVRGDTVLLVVEVADSSLGFDLGYKSRVYASYGVREYWVINANTLETTVHLLPRIDTATYGDVGVVAGTEQLTPSLAPSLAVRLADLGIG